MSLEPVVFINVSYSNKSTSKCWWLIPIEFYFSLTQSPLKEHSALYNDSRNQTKESLSSSTHDFPDFHGYGIGKIENEGSQVGQVWKWHMKLLLVKTHTHSHTCKGVWKMSSTCMNRKKRNEFIQDFSVFATLSFFSSCI